MDKYFSQPEWLEAQGRREGRYLIGPLLGHGAMGDVHEAWDVVLARPVALKILHQLEPAAMIRFMHEAQLHARLDNPNICRIYDVDANGGTPRIAMQLVRGPNLEDAAPDLKLEEILAILARVAEAVHAAHQQQLIHRDLKPSNILLQWREPEGWVPYVCDFGLAMDLDGPSLTQPQAVTGTPAYMAPEQVQGDRALVGPATDVYGLGSTLYFALLGRPPCVSTTPAEMLRVKRERRFPAPRSLDPDLDPRLEAILLKCLEPDPRDRYPSALALAIELRGYREALLRGREGRERLRAAARRLLRGWRGAVAGLAALAALAALAGAGRALYGRYLRQRRLRAEREQNLVQAAASLKQGIENERFLPPHDLRPAMERSRRTIAALRRRFAGQGADFDGALALALGRAEFLLRDWAAARRDLERAWAAQVRTPEAASFLARVDSHFYRAYVLESRFRGEEPGPDTEALRNRALGLFALGGGQTAFPREYVAAQESYLRQDYVRGLAEAQASLNANPWHLDSAYLGAKCLEAQATRHRETGDDAAAAADDLEALALVEPALAKGPSDQRLRHAYCLARLGLAVADLDAGSLTSGTLADLTRAAEQALSLDPDDPDSQSDWLQVQILAALRLRRLGGDPTPELDRALAFYWARTREPRTPDLRIDHMVLYWLQAEREFTAGEDPGASLVEALKRAGHAVGRPRDYLGDLWNLQARVQAAQGLDPRPTVAATVAWYTPLAAGNRLCCAGEIAGGAWLVRAEWELRQGLNPTDSLAQARPLLGAALACRPGSAGARAMLGQSRLLEARWAPARRADFAAQAAADLAEAARRNPRDPEVDRLRRLARWP